jgi:hypothetical protein
MGFPEYDPERAKVRRLQRYRDLELEPEVDSGSRFRRKLIPNESRGDGAKVVQDPRAGF